MHGSILGVILGSKLAEHPDDKLITKEEGGILWIGLAQDYSR